MCRLARSQFTLFLGNQITFSYSIKDEASTDEAKAFRFSVSENRKKLEAQGPCTGHRSIISKFCRIVFHENNVDKTLYTIRN